MGKKEKEKETKENKKYKKGNKKEKQLRENYIHFNEGILNSQE